MPCASVGGLSPADHADCQPHAAADTGLGQNARHPDSGTPEPPPAGRRSTPAVFCAEPPHRLLRRGQGRLQPVRCVAAIMNAVAVLPLVDGLLGRPEPFR
jgi:hypothetical protein